MWPHLGFLFFCTFILLFGSGYTFSRRCYGRCDSLEVLVLRREQGASSSCVYTTTSSSGSSYRLCQCEQWQMVNGEYGAREKGTWGCLRHFAAWDGDVYVFICVQTLFDQGTTGHLDTLHPACDICRPVRGQRSTLGQVVWRWPATVNECCLLLPLFKCLSVS